MSLKRILVTAILGIASMHELQTVWAQSTDHWFVVRDAPDLTYAFEFVCFGDRITAQDTAAGLRILDSDGSVHALPERAFKAEQGAGLINSAFKELLCAAGTAIDREVNETGEQSGRSDGLNIPLSDPVTRLPSLGTLTQEPGVAIPAQIMRSRRQASSSRRSSQASINVRKAKYPLLIVLLASVPSRRP